MPSPLFALLIGINRYVAPIIPTLQGCRNDVELLAGVLRDRFETPDANLRILFDEQATRSEILRAFREHLIDRARLAKQSGETSAAYLFHFSGHGSLARDASGTKANGLDETIVPHDSRQQDVFDIRDWELGGLLDELAQYTSNITVVLDCCHSGSGTRDEAASVRQCPPDERAAPVAPPIASGTRGDAPMSPPTPNSHVLLAACSANQSANETVDASLESKPKHGVMSFALADVWRSSPAQGLTYREIHQQVCQRVWRTHPFQAPQCEGDRDRVLFGGIRPPRELWISVTGHSDGLVAIDAGRVHGLTEGSELDIYGPDQRTIAENPTVRGRLRVARPDAIKSLCHVIESTRIEGTPPAIGSRLSPRSLGQSLIASLSIDDPQGDVRDALAKRLAEPELASVVRLVSQPDVDLKLVRRGASVSLYDPSSSSLDNPLPDDAIDAIVRQVRKWAFHLNALRIENLSPQSALRDKVGVEFAFPKATPAIDPNRPVLETGTVVQIKLTNRSADPLFVYALAFGYDGSIALAWPPMAGEQVPLSPGKSVTSRAFKLAFQPGESRSRVREAIKVFATRSPTDFEVLTMDGEGRRDGKRSLGKGNALTQLLSQASDGRSTRLLQPVEIPTEEDWGTSTLAYEMVRPTSELQTALAAQQTTAIAGTSFQIVVPEGFAGTIRPLSATGQRSTEDVASSNHALWLPVRSLPGSIEPANWGDDGQAVSALELQVSDDLRTIVTRDTPLRIVPGIASQGQRDVSTRYLVIATDGEHLFPVGASTADGASIDIEWLPPSPEPSAGKAFSQPATRSVLRSLRLFLFKVLQWEVPSPGIFSVRWVPTDRLASDPLLTGERKRSFPQGEVRKRPVSPADVLPDHRVLVVVHGMLSDGESMIASVAPLLAQANRTYEHILAFEYETLATPLAESGKRLYESLKQLGLTTATGGDVDIVAAGTGTLVVRAALELSEPGQRIRRCLFAGPPNRGTPLALSQNLAKWLGTIALTKTALMPVWLAVNMAFNKAVGDLLAIRDLQPASEFLASLKTAKTKPTAAYTILAGSADESHLLGPWVRRLADTAIDLLLDDEHDLVCTHASMTKVRDGDYPAELLKVEFARADHFSYWTEPTAVEHAVRWLANGTGKAS